MHTSTPTLQQLHALCESLHLDMDYAHGGIALKRHGAAWITASEFPTIADAYSGATAVATGIPPSLMLI